MEAWGPDRWVSSGFFAAKFRKLFFCAAVQPWFAHCNATKRKIRSDAFGKKVAKFLRGRGELKIGAKWGMKND